MRARSPRPSTHMPPPARRRRQVPADEPPAAAASAPPPAAAASAAGLSAGARALIDADAAPALQAYREFLGGHATAAAARMATSAAAAWTTTTRDARTGRQLPARVAPPAYEAYEDARSARSAAFQAALSALSAAEYRAAVTGEAEARGAVVEAARAATDAARALWAVERWRVHRVRDAPDAARAELAGRLDALTAEAASGPDARVRVADARRRVRVAMTEGAAARPLPDACLALVTRAPDVKTGAEAAQTGGAALGTRLERALAADATLARLMDELKQRRRKLNAE